MLMGIRVFAFLLSLTVATVRVKDGGSLLFSVRDHAIVVRGEIVMGSARNPKLRL